MHSTPLPSMDEWTQALDLKRRGVEWCGPCPLCGGEDRFHVRPGRNGAALAGCRGCMDGRPEGERRERFGEVLKAAFPDRSTNGRAHSPKRPVGSRGGGYKPRLGASERSSTPQSSTAALARELWAASERATVGNPAGLYLVRRWCWPPDRETAGGPLPPDVRWLPRQQFPPELKGFPSGSIYTREGGAEVEAAGLLLFGFRPVAGGEVAAVSVEGVTQDGDRMDWRRDKPTDPFPCIEGERWRRTYGSRKGAAFQAASGDRAVVLVEGEVSALACRWLHPGCRVLACGGASGLLAVARAVKPGQALILEVDRDPAGQNAVLQALERLPIGTVAHGWTRTPGTDAADDLRETLEGCERAAIVGYDGESTRSAADRAAWKEWRDNPWMACE